MSNTVHSNPLDEYLATAAPAEVEVDLCLDRELRDRHTAAELELALLLSRQPTGMDAAAKEASADRLAAEQHEKAQEILALQDEIAANSATFLLRNITWAERGILTACYPPRDDSPGDKRTGYNRAEVYPRLVAKCVKRITLPGKEPTDVTPEQWERFAEILEPEQMEMLAVAAVNLVWRPANPTSALASRTLTQTSGAKSKPRATSRSRTNAS